MNKLTMSEFKKLMDYTAEKCISLYVPTPETGAQGHMQPAHLHNAFRESMEQAKLTQFDKIEKLDKIFNEIANSEDFRAERVAGFAVFVGANSDYWWFVLPNKVAPLVVASHKFHVRPLLPAVMSQPHFYLLSLNKENVKMFKGDEHGLAEVHVTDLPTNQEAVVGVESDDRQVRLHTASTDAVGGQHLHAQFHGPSWKDDNQKYEDKFMEAIDKAVTKFLEAEKSDVVLVVAGVERMLTDYERVSTSPHFKKDLTLRGNFQRDSLLELHEKAMPLLEPYYSDQSIKKVTEWMQTDSAEKFSTDLSEILKEARMGRIESLIVSQDDHVWGNFDPNTMEIHFDEGPNGNNLDLLDVACTETMYTDGKVYVISNDKMPNGIQVAAVYRY
jgi:hypothetical protein